ncbi:MAG: hypothetical protein RLZZ301_86 [Bacteroidota bacterium]|jgi:hypothetical protein
MNKDKQKQTNKQMWIASLSTAVVSGILALLGIYIIQDYGIALFILIPFLMGALPTFIYNRNEAITWKISWQLAMLTLTICTISLIVFAIEGLICILMALPIAILFLYLGAWLAFMYINRKQNKDIKPMFVLIAFIPIIQWIEKNSEPEIKPVTTSIEIAATPEQVWKQVVEFPRLKAPKEYLFRAGIAYPTHATIKGTGVGAIRYCHFTTGCFVEPIQIWQAPKRLQFSVLEQPEPMKELSFWDIDAPHLHDYFVSKKGQFKLTRLANGHTKLEGTTWYYHNIRPAIYWRAWSDYIIHKIHLRVLRHIKHNAERNPIN